ncbi:MAG: hypothetical protein JWN95_1562 [Frankiales bacterium]|nr:hypothetical protein [Frankiales bacterium]
MSRSSREDGNAIVEFVFVAILVLVPLVYLVVAVAQIQRGRIITVAAARDVGRALTDAPDPGQARIRADAALRVSLSAAELTPADVQIRLVEASANCSAPAIDPTFEPGSEFAICISLHQHTPGIPGVVGGRGIQSIGRYVVRLDDFNPARPGS